jgi:hypothetical protein
MGRERGEAIQICYLNLDRFVACAPRDDDGCALPVPVMPVMIMPVPEGLMRDQVCDCADRRQRDRRART